jgi:hypothetical protein
MQTVSSARTVRIRTAADRQPTNEQAGVIEDDDASVLQRLFNCGKIGQQHCI